MKRWCWVALLALLSAEAHAAAPPSRLTLARSALQQAGRLANQAYQRALAGRFAEALKLDTQTLALRRLWLGQKHPLVQGSEDAVERWRRLINLPAQEQEQLGLALRSQSRADGLRRQGRYVEAEKADRRALKIQRQILGEEHPDTASSYNNVAFCLKGQDKLALALPLFEKALAICKKVLGEENSSTAICYSNVAYCFKSQGKIALALALYEKALAICNKVFGEEHPYTAMSCHNVALCLDAKGKHALALPLFERALRIRKMVLGEEHPDIAVSYNSTAACLEAQDKPALALPLYEKALAISRKVRGEEHSDTATGYNNAGMCLNAQHKYDLALPLLEKALAISRKIWGEKHPDTATCYNNVALCLDNQLKHALALPLYEKALAIRKRVLGEEHPHTAQSYDNLGDCLHKQGKHALALPLCEKALAIFRKVLGEEHPDTVTSYNNVALILDAQGKYALALPLFEKVLTIRKKARGEEHPDTAASYHNVAFCLNNQGRYALALPLFEKALATCKKILGEDHPVTATNCNNMAMCLDRMGKHKLALPLHEKALAIRRKARGEEHPDTANSYHNVAYCQNAEGKHAQALPLFEKALAICKKVLGEEHPHTALSYHSVALCLYEQDKGERAEQVAEQACRAFQVARLHVGFAGLERSSFSERRAPQLLLALLRARAGKADAAWQSLETHLARGLLDEVAARHRLLPAKERQQLDDLRGKWNLHERQLLALAGKGDAESQRQLKRLREQSNQAGRELRELQAQLAEKYGPVAGAVYNAKRIQKSLTQDEALLGWLDMGNENWACLLRQRGVPIWVKLPAADKSAIEKLALELGRSPGSPSEANPTWLTLAQRLHKQRLAPLDKHLGARDGLPAVRHLIVLPSPALAEVPVETLLLAGKSDLTVSYTPSATLFAYLQQNRDKAAPGQARLLALGDPLYDQPAAEDEDDRAARLPQGGLFLSELAPGGNAARSGLRAGDVLLRYGTSKLSSAEDLASCVQKHAADQEKVGLEVWRGRRVLRCKIDPGPLGVRLSKKSAAHAVRARQADALLTRSLRQTFAPLPGTRGEVEAIAKLFPSCDALLGANASEQSLDEMASKGKLKGYRFLHLATHGQASERKPLESFLALCDKDLPDPLSRVLAGKPAYTGRLTARQILQGWDLDAELVVLSACQSGLGRYQGGEGYVGFAQPLFAVGARSLVVSLWSVPDKSTALLMVRFYQNLLGKRPGLKAPLSKAESLREAKHWLRSLSTQEADKALKALSPKLKLKESERASKGKPFAHPFFWAAFILAGDPGPVSLTGKTQP